MSYPLAEKRIHFNTNQNLDEIITSLSQLPHHFEFKNLYLKSKLMTWSNKKQIHFLSCMYHYLKIDFDKDGVFDWKIISNSQILSHLVENDKDWDNDGIINLLDDKPLQMDWLSALKSKDVPQHLKLERNLISSKNDMQNEIYETCGLLPINYSDQHMEAVLASLLGLCKILMAPTKNDQTHLLIVYAFASHAINNGIIASFYPETNQMSVGGELSRKVLKNTKKINLTLAHELGHYFTFNYLTPQKLLSFYNQHNPGDIRIEEVNSFYDETLTLPIMKHEPFPLKSEYAKTNIHEWFSEFFAHDSLIHLENKWSEKTKGLFVEKMTAWNLVHESLQSRSIQ